jgi:dolichol-phosphate mannosyltransferase
MNDFDALTGAGVAVCIPTFNESESIAEIVARTRASLSQALIVIIDDASPDGTGQIADELAELDKNMRVIHNPSKAGLGNAYRVGFAQVMRDRPEIHVLVSMDADGSHDPATLPLMLSTLETADLAQGSRWVPGGQVVNWPKWREALSRGGNAYARVLLDIDLGDATGGFRAYRKSLLESIDFGQTTSDGYCFQVEMATRAVKRGLRVKEIPIVFTERLNGVSKMSRSIVIEAFGRIGIWGLQGLFGQKPFDR